MSAGDDEQQKLFEDPSTVSTYRVTISCACGTTFASENFASVSDGREAILRKPTLSVCPKCNRRHVADVCMVMATPRRSEKCRCEETYPQLQPGRVSHGPGCSKVQP